MSHRSKSKSIFNHRAGTTSVNQTATVGGYPDHSRVRLRYVTNVNRSIANVTGGDYVFRANGCFDPDFTSTGGQPANWDDWSAAYTRYRVWGSRISWNMSNDATGTNDSAQFVIGPRHTSTAITTRANQENFQAQPYTVSGKSIIYNNGMPDCNTRGSMSMSTEKFLGLTRAEFLGNDDISSVTTADPTHLWYWHLTVQADDQSSSFTMYFNIVIEYDVEFWDRVDTTLDLKYERLLAMRRLKELKDHEAKSEGFEEVSRPSSPTPSQTCHSGDPGRVPTGTPRYDERKAHHKKR